MGVATIGGWIRGTRMKASNLRAEIKIKQTFLPLDGAFFGRVDLGEVWGFAEEEAFDVVEEEILSVGIREIEAVVIDNLGLLLQPATPARLANLRRDPLPKLVWKWREPQSRALLATM